MLEVCRSGVLVAAAAFFLGGADRRRCLGSAAGTEPLKQTGPPPPAMATGTDGCLRLTAAEGAR